MKLNHWKIFSKSGSPINWFADPYINLTFGSNVGKNAAGYIITDPSGYVSEIEITSGGYMYDSTTTVSYNYIYGDEGDVDITSDVSINYIDVSIFRGSVPGGENSWSVKDVSISSQDVSGNFVYPSVVYSSAIYLKPVSVGLAETEHLFILEDVNGTLIRPYDSSNSTLVFEMYGDEDEISLFSINEEEQTINWTNQLIFDVSAYQENSPITVNIGFRSEDEGVYERRLRAYHVIDNTYYLLAEIIVNAESIGEDERFRTLIGNFGLPDPKDFPKLFKETDINEDLPDWEIVNQKSKHMILEHDNIMPYIGTYKALVNAIKWLGYDDIYIREWFKNVKDNRKISLIIPYDAKERAQTILKFSPDERKTLKKLNQLSLNYCLTSETGEVDEWGTPITENCYEYNLQEVFLKLLSLKTWLEKNIIGVNCRIIDITGDGVYFERFRNTTYSTDNVGFNYRVEQFFTPKTIDKSSELVRGDSSIGLTLLEITNSKITSLPVRFLDMIDYVWDPCTGLSYNILDPALLTLDPSLTLFLLVGPPISYPFKDLREIQWKVSVEKPDAGVLGYAQVTNPLFIYENEIKFYNVYDSSSIFYNASTNLNILLEKTYFRDPSIDVWEDSIAWSLYPNASDNGYILESSTGVLISFDDYMSLNPSTGAVLQYAVDSNYRVPLLSMDKFTFMDSSAYVHTFPKEYYLDIADGKISMENGGNNQLFINFQYDTSLEEQKITLNVVYQSPRLTLFSVDPSVYYWADPSGRTGGNDPQALSMDNSVYYIPVNHIGDYNIEVFGWDGYNALLYNITPDTYKVWIKTPTIYSLIDTCINIINSSTYISLEDVSTLISQNPYPIYDRLIPLQGLRLQIDSDGRPYIHIPSITYFQDVPEAGSLNRFFNLTERVLTISGNSLTIDPDYQNFYTGDDVKLVKFHKGKFEFIFEASSHITNATGTSLTMDNVHPSITIDASSDVYILNDTYRYTLNPSNNYDVNTLTIDISGYSFRENQLVGLIISDVCTNYSWGSSYRVLSVDGSTHVFDGMLPQQFVDNQARYVTQAKHAFSTYASFTIDTATATETNNEFNIYLTDSFCHEYYLDNTFTFVNVLFDQEKVNQQWYDVSDNLVNSAFYYHDNPIIIDVSTLVILKAQYDNSTYMLNHKNIWTVKNNLSKDIVFKVYNQIAPYIFDVSGYYDVLVESYDSFGNMEKKTYEGLIQVK